MSNQLIAERLERMVGKAQQHLDHLLTTNPVVEQIREAQIRLAVAEAGDYVTYRELCRKGRRRPMTNTQKLVRHAQDTLAVLRAKGASEAAIRDAEHRAQIAATGDVNRYRQLCREAGDHAHTN